MVLLHKLNIHRGKQETICTFASVGTMRYSKQGGDNNCPLTTNDGRRTSKKLVLIMDIYSEKAEKKVALYCRLSQDDGKKEESNSITNQKDILLTYAKNNGFHNTEFFVDDGISGTTFNRPGFQRMLKLINEGMIGTVVVKDLSRFGRNYLEVGNYLEMIFPTKGIRFISIQENIDSKLNNSNELVPFNNIFNEWYAAQTSKKIRTVYKQRSADGKRVSPSVPYGYVRDPNNRDIWHIDEDAAKVVRKIFALFLDGYGPSRIADILHKEKVLTPTAYNIQLGRPAKHKLRADPYLWSDSTVVYILDNMQYTGCTVNNITTRLSYKINKTIFNDRADWVVIPNTQPAIIDDFSYQRVQELRKNRYRRIKTGKTSMFSNLVFCADCGSKLHYCVTRKAGGLYGHYRCSQYKNGSRNCTSHFISDIVLTKVVTESIRKLASFVSCYEPVFVYLMQKQQTADQEEERKQLKQRLETANKRIEELDKLIQRTYEDNILGRLSDDRYHKMASAFEAEQQQHIQFVDDYKDKLLMIERTAVDTRKILDMLRSFQEVNELTPTMVNTMIERIVVHDDNLMKKGKKTCVDIYYTALGLLQIPSEEELKALIKEIQ